MLPYERVLAYWFAEADHTPLTKAALGSRPPMWFRPNESVDNHIRQEFGPLVEAAVRGELDSWAASPRGRLALVVLLDQFPRNMHRGKAGAFAHDKQALDLVHDGIKSAVDSSFNEAHRIVFYLPLMHAEDADVQRLSLEKYRALRDGAPAELGDTLATVYSFAEKHAAIVQRFGRYPHRNKQLGRETTPEEAEFLTQPNSAF